MSRNWSESSPCRTIRGRWHVSIGCLQCAGFSVAHCASVDMTSVDLTACSAVTDTCSAFLCTSDWLHSVHFKAAAAGKPLICSQTADQPNPHQHIQTVSCSRGSGKVITDSDWLKPGLMWECDSLRPELCPSACIHKQLHNSFSSSLTLFMAHLQHLDLASHLHCFKHTLYLYHVLRPHSTKQSCCLWLRLSVFLISQVPFKRDLCFLSAHHVSISQPLIDDAVGLRAVDILNPAKASKLRGGFHHSLCWQHFFFS